MTTDVLGQEYMTESAPSSRVAGTPGPRNVLSTVTGGRAPSLFAERAAPTPPHQLQIDPGCSVGFAGVSVTISATRAAAFAGRARAPPRPAVMTALRRLQASDTSIARMPKVRQGLLDKGFSSAVQRLAHQDHVVRPKIGPERGRDGRHPARGTRARLRRPPTAPADPPAPRGWDY